MLQRPVNSLDENQVDHLKNKLSVYELEQIDPMITVNILGEDGLTELYQASNLTTTTSKRDEFIDILVNNVLHNPTTDNEISVNTDPNQATITLLRLLNGDKNLLELYKAAIVEESKCRRFREAVFLKSTEFKAGKTWPKRMIILVGGPSASGKTYAKDLAIQIASRKMSRSRHDDGNFITSIDGAIERETSQIRKLVISTAIQKGYSGISDLETHTTLTVKFNVRSAVLSKSDVSLVIPETFTNGLKRGDLVKYLHLQNTVCYFCHIVGDEAVTFQESVKRMGENRAWFRHADLAPYHPYPHRQLVMNADPGCESKAYGAKHFTAGVSQSQQAADLFYHFTQDGIRVNKHHYVRVTNDLVFVTLDDNKKWRACVTEDPISTIKMTARQLAKLTGLQDEMNIHLTEQELEYWLNESEIKELGTPLVLTNSKPQMEKVITLPTDYINNAAAAIAVNTVMMRAATTGLKHRPTSAVVRPQSSTLKSFTTDSIRKLSRYATRLSNRPHLDSQADDSNNVDISSASQTELNDSARTADEILSLDESGHHTSDASHLRYMNTNKQPTTQIMMKELQRYLTTTKYYSLRAELASKSSHTEYELEKLKELSYKILTQIAIIETRLNNSIANTETGLKNYNTDNEKIAAQYLLATIKREIEKIRKIEIDDEHVAHFSDKTITVETASINSEMLHTILKQNHLTTATNGGFLVSADSRCITREILNKTAKIAETQSRIDIITLQSKSFLSRQTKLVNVAAVHSSKNGLYKSDFYYHQDEIKKLSNDELIKLAIFTVEDFKAGPHTDMLNTVNETYPLIIRGKMDARLVRHIATYCALKNYPYKNHVNSFAPNQSALQALDKKLNRNAHTLFNEAELLAFSPKGKYSQTHIMRESEISARDNNKIYAQMPNIARRA